MHPAAGPIAHGLIGRHFRITDLDAAYGALLGVSPEAAVGRTVVDFIHPDDRLAASLVLRRAWTDGQAIATTHRHRHADGTAIWVNIYISRIGTGDAQRLVVTCRPLPPESSLPSTVEAQWQMARLLIQALDGGKRAFGDALIGNPATEILLLAYVAEAEARAIRAGDLATRINVTWSLARRWLAALADAGFVEAEVPGPIQQDTPIRLSPRALAMIEAIFGALIAVVQGSLVAA